MLKKDLKKILLVDDEQNVLNALRRELKGQFEIEMFTNPLQALEHCTQTSYDLVIADYKMPEINGIEFLKRFGALQPDAARLVLSGEADIDALLRTINETHIYRFLAKPWEKAELLSCIAQALNYREVILQSRQTEAKTLPSTPAPYRIILAEHDEHLLALMTHGLTDESGRENLYVAMQQEVGQDAKGQFKCVVEGCRTAASALKRASSGVDLIITSQKLPDMDGLQLLNQMRQIQPDAARILISDDPDKNMLSQAINETEVQNLLTLHWCSYELHSDVRRRAWNLYQLKTAAIQALASREQLLKN